MFGQCVMCLCGSSKKTTSELCSDQKVVCASSVLFSFPLFHDSLFGTGIVEQFSRKTPSLDKTQPQTSANLRPYKRIKSYINSIPKRLQYRVRSNSPRLFGISQLYRQFFRDLHVTIMQRSSIQPCHCSIADLKIIGVVSDVKRLHGNSYHFAFWRQPHPEYHNLSLLTNDYPLNLDRFKITTTLLPYFILLAQLHVLHLYSVEQLTPSESLLQAYKVVLERRWL